MPADEQLREAFQLFDANGSGTIDRTELFYALKGLGYQIDDAEADEMITAADDDHSGEIDFEEFKRLVSERETEGSGPREVMRAFHAFDVRGVGVVTTDDLRTVASSLGYSTDQVTEDDIAEIHKYCAENDNGRLTAYAWRQTMAKVSSHQSKRSAAVTELPDQHDAIWHQVTAEEDAARESRLGAEREQIERQAAARHRAQEARERLAQHRTEALEAEAQRERDRVSQWGQSERERAAATEKLAKKRELRAASERAERERVQQREDELRAIEEQVARKRAAQP
eukprot:Hpha_TRINITY_DN9481_c0_g1::TRINITY_DN9481_c0_g1_i1::g.139105::m.139105/K16465/CETN1; centrin-1